MSRPGPGFGDEGASVKVYTASKVKHAHLWLGLREQGLQVVATWIDEAGEGQTTSYQELAERCVQEVKTADLVLLYCEPEELLKGALVEAGAALAFGKPVLCVGDCPSISRVFRSHPLWIALPTMDAALEEIRKRSRLSFGRRCWGRVRAAFRSNEPQKMAVGLFTAGNMLACLQAKVSPRHPMFWAALLLWPAFAFLANLIDPIPVQTKE
jgi:hypothetical protein